MMNWKLLVVCTKTMSQNFQIFNYVNRLKVNDFFFLVLGIEPNTLNLLGKRSVTELQSQP
jgi:hypothetical protein